MTAPEVRWRTAESTDAAFVEALLLTDALLELGLVPDPARSHLAGVQVAARRAGYAEKWPDAEDNVITADGVPVGRLLLTRTPRGLHIVDFRVAASARGRGIGSAVLATLCAEADDARLAITLTAASTNPAVRLYLRAGFTSPRIEQEHGLDTTWTRPTLIDRSSKH